MTRLDTQRRMLTIGLNTLGIVVVAVGLVQIRGFAMFGWDVALTAIALLAWAVRTVLPRRLKRTIWSLNVLMIVAGGLAVVPANGVAIIPAIAGMVFLLADLAVPVVVSVGISLLGAACIAVGALGQSVSLSEFLSVESGAVLAILFGFNRRQSRVAEEQATALAEERLAVREEQARTAVFAERSRIARDIHDVLAHSLGGLVIQLDAVEALVEAGRDEDALARIRAARLLAASGLSDARRAVETLREVESEPVEAAALERSIAELLEAHRGLGGIAEFLRSGAARAVTEDQATALRRTVQEGLSNARKHAPGELVLVSLDWTASRVSLELRNRVSLVPSAPTSGLAASGGGHGLTGMAERFAALPGGSTSAGVRDNEFVVRVETEVA